MPLTQLIDSAGFQRLFLWRIGMHRPLAVIISTALLLLLLLPPLLGMPASAAPPPVVIGFDAEVGHATSTSDEAIRMGLLAAIHEINAAGGILGGRPLELLVKDHRSVPARGVKNIVEFSEVPDLVAVVGGKFSPVMLEEVPLVHERRVILLSAWGAADTIVDNGHDPNYCFRVSLKDSWAIQVILQHARQRGFKKLGVLLPVTGWGRSNEKVIRQALNISRDMAVTSFQWYMWGDKSLMTQYQAIRATGADAVLLVANEAEGSILVRELANLPAQDRLPLVSHWGVTGGAFTSLTGPAIELVDLAVIQTYSFFNPRPCDSLERFFRTVGQLFNIQRPEDIPSPVGMAHAYDLTYILAQAVEKAGSTDRAAVRDALEQVRDVDGLIKWYQRPFSPDNHEALLPDDLFMARFRADGAIIPLGH